MRDFRAKLKSYLARISQGESFEVSGVHVCKMGVHAKVIEVKDGEVEGAKVKYEQLKKDKKFGEAGSFWTLWNNKGIDLDNV